MALAPTHLMDGRQPRAACLGPVALGTYPIPGLATQGTVPLLVQEPFMIAGVIRIDNREELFSELGILTPISDVALVLAAHQRWDTEAPQHLVGDFAYILWNNRSEELFAARDAMGSIPLYTIERLHDGLPDTPVPPWRSADAVFPIDISLSGIAPELFAKVVIWNHANEDPSTYIREFEIYITIPAEQGGLARRELIGTFTALPTDAKQVFLLEETVITTTTIVRILDNHGGDYVSAAEIGLFNPTVNTRFGNPTISQGPLP